MGPAPNHPRSGVAVNPLERRVEHARACFVHACRLDVEVRKPGNVSQASPGHGMHAEQFIRSASAAAGPLFALGARVGPRIQAAVAASWTAAGCNTNLGIVLLCAPIAAAIEFVDPPASAAALRTALAAVLEGLDRDDARAAYRAIAHANPAGLGAAPAQDVRAEPSVDLRAVMALAAQRDSIARQYATAYAELFECSLPLLCPGFTPVVMATINPIDRLTTQRIQRVYLEWLARCPDSHIVRKHGAAVAHIVMAAAQGWQRRADPGADPAFAAWDESLKAQRINPGTSADLTVAAMLLAGVLAS